MKITVLMEDSENDGGMLYEHGFSVFIETRDTAVIVDTGASEKTWANAEKAGIPLCNVEKVFLSHGHYDHSGGILSFAKINPDAQIYLHPGATLDYFSFNHDPAEYIGIDKAICDLPNISYISENTEMGDGISVFCDVTGRRKWPGSNLALKQRIDGEYVQDSFGHEIYVVIRENGKSVLVSGCAHNGILNILDRFREIYESDPDIVISGFHMMKSGSYTDPEAELIADIAKELSSTDIRFYTGHCTGRPAYDIMQPIMGNRMEYVHSGTVIEL